MGELEQAVELLRRDVNHLSLTLALHEGEYEAAIDAEFELRKSGDKGNLEAIDAAFNAMAEHKENLIAELEAAIDLATERSLETVVCRQLIEALRGGFDMPKPEQFIFGASVELANLLRAVKQPAGVKNSSIPQAAKTPQIIVVPNGINICGELIALKPKQHELVELLVDGAGEFIPLSEHGYKTRDTEGLPAALREMIESQPGAGTRIFPKWFS